MDTPHLILFIGKRFKNRKNHYGAMRKIGEERILQTMIENGKPMGIRAIADTLDCPYETVYYHVVNKFGRGRKSLLKGGYIKAMDGKGRRFLEVTRRGRNYYKALLKAEKPEVGDREVLRVMIERGKPIMTSEIARELGCDRSLVRYYLWPTSRTPNRKSLLDRGYVKIEEQSPVITYDDGTTRVYRSYTVTEKGRDYLLNEKEVEHRGDSVRTD